MLVNPQLGFLEIQFFVKIRFFWGWFFCEWLQYYDIVTLQSFLVSSFSNKDTSLVMGGSFLMKPLKPNKLQHLVPNFSYLSFNIHIRDGDANIQLKTKLLY